MKSATAAASDRDITWAGRDACGTVQGATYPSLLAACRAGAAFPGKREDADGEAIFVADAEGVIRYVSPSFEQATGASRYEFIGRRFTACFHPGTATEREMRDVLDRGEPWAGTFSVGWPGDAGGMDGVISPVCDAFGRLVSYVAVKKDISRERTMEERLRDSPEMEAVGRLTGGIAHMFNNLMTIVIGYGDRLLSGVGDNQELRRQVEEILKAGERTALLTRQLLAFGRRQTMQPRPVLLSALVASMERLLSRLMGDGISVLLLLHDDSGKVMVDPIRMEQVIMNLAANARDAMPHGGSLVIETAGVIAEGDFVQRHPFVRPGKYVLLSVSDTGTGMTEDVRARVFEPFFTTREKAAGLGLSAAYGTVKQSGGYIFADSRPGNGACFRIYLPLASCLESSPAEGTS